MTVIGVTAMRASPGATSLTVGLGAAWVQLVGEALVVEADPSGGILRLRFDLPGNPSLASLSAELRRTRTVGVVEANTVDLNGSRCLTLPFDPAVAASVLHRSAGPMADLLGSVERPVAIDLGRLDRQSPTLPLAVAADAVLVVFRPRIDEIQGALYTVRLLRTIGAKAYLVTVGDRPHHPSEVADLAGVQLAAALPDDPTMAAAFSGGRYQRRRLQRSTLWRSMVSLGQWALDDFALPNEPGSEAEPTWPPPDERELVVGESSALGRQPAAATGVEVGP